MNKNSNNNKNKRQIIKKRYGKGPEWPLVLLNETKRTICWSHFIQYTAAGLSVQTYRLNSLYDPDESGAGTQPVGFDEIMAIYEYYRVEKVHVIIEAINAGTAAIIAVMPNRSSTDPTQITAMAANNSGRAKSVAGTYGQNKVTFDFWIDIKDYLGLKMNIGDDLNGTTSGGPARTVFLHIGMEEMDLSAKDISLFCRFEYQTRFLSPLALNNS